jgi:NADH-quinone oxidoreductase subunit C
MLTPAAIAERIVEVLGPDAVAAHPLDGLHPHVVVPAEHWPDVALALRDEPDIALDFLCSITGLDYPDRQQLCAAYDLISFEHQHEFAVKIFVPRAHSEIPSVAHVWRAADWHEREAYDLLGIRFTDHPDSVTDAAGTHPRRILLPDDWQGHPLRKDYAFPRAYHGIPGSVEIDWAQKENYPK